MVIHTSTQHTCSLLAFSVSGNYYGTPRPVHISAESPPVTYQEHRNLLRNFRTRSKSLSNLEKAAEEGDNSEDDSGLSGKYRSTCSAWARSRLQIRWKKNERWSAVNGILSGVLHRYFIVFQPAENCDPLSQALAQQLNTALSHLSIASVSDTQINQSFARLVCAKLSVGLWPHWLLDLLQRKVRPL